MEDHSLGELFGVLRQLGFERQAPPIPRVPERPATIYVDVQSCWVKADWNRTAFIFGICHSYPRTQISIVAGAYLVRPEAWFDVWIARAKAAPLQLMAERRSDGCGVLVWREPPTRASFFERVRQLNESAPH